MRLPDEIAVKIKLNLMVTILIFVFMRILFGLKNLNLKFDLTFCELQKNIYLNLTSHFKDEARTEKIYVKRANHNTHA